MNNQSETSRMSGTESVDGEMNGRAVAGAAMRPPVDIFETDDSITVQADMPGVSRDRLSLRLEGSNLLVEGRIEIPPQPRLHALHADVRSDVFRKSFLLSNELEAGRIDASLKDGVLTVRIPKRPELLPRRIEVRTG
jgi:HSP20 family protein